MSDNQAENLKSAPYQFLIFGWLLVPGMVMMIVIGSRITTAQQAEPQGAVLATFDTSNSIGNCRYGTSPLESAHIPWVATLGAGWFLNFSASTDAIPTNDAEYYHVVRVSQDKDVNGNYLQTYTTVPQINSASFNNLIDSNPGHIWIIGNEADRGPNEGQTKVNQDDTFPDMYATIYHDVYEYIKGRDPTALIANTSMVQVTPGRLQYLDIVWDAYLEKYGNPMQVDVWNMHVYILPEVNQQGQVNSIASVALGTDPALGKRESGGSAAQCPLNSVYCFAEHDDLAVYDEQVRAMRTWMRDHGQRNKPLIISEYSILYPYEVDGGGCFLQDEYGNCFTPTRVNNFMEASFDYLENAVDGSLGYPVDNNRLVQQWLWFSVKHEGVGYVSDLINSSETSLTLVGQTFQEQTSTQPVLRNLTIEQATAAVGLSGGGGTADVILSVKFRNNGNTVIDTPFKVTFLDGNTIIGESVISPVVRGCAVHTYSAAVTWNNLPPGKHDFQVSLDHDNDVSESNESDNVAESFVLVDPEQLHLPLTTR